jgi:hypothetical protein
VPRSGWPIREGGTAANHQQLTNHALRGRPLQFGTLRKGKCILYVDAK